MKTCREDRNLFKIEIKYRALHMKKIGFTTAGDLKSPQKPSLSATTVSRDYDNRGGINIMRTCHNIALYAHCPACFAAFLPFLPRFGSDHDICHIPVHCTLQAVPTDANNPTPRTCTRAECSVTSSHGRRYSPLHVVHSKAEREEKKQNCLCG